MGGAAATGDLEKGYLTQTWLAVSNDSAATVSGGYWYHRQRQAPAPQARDPAFQDQLLDRLAALTGVALLYRRGCVQQHQPHGPRDMATRELPVPGGTPVPATTLQTATLAGIADLFTLVVETPDDLPG